MPYAEHTNVAPEKSRMEIEQALNRYGASAFMYATTTAQSMVQFMYQGRNIRIVLAKPDVSKLKVRWYGNVRDANPDQKAKFISDEGRRQWRALLLVIKAKLEAVQSKIATFDDEFMAYVVMPNGQTMGEWMRPQIEQAVANGHMPKMLMSGS